MSEHADLLGCLLEHFNLIREEVCKLSQTNHALRQKVLLGCASNGGELLHGARVLQAVQFPTQYYLSHLTGSQEEATGIVVMQRRVFHFNLTVVDSENLVTVRHVEIALENRVWDEEWSQYLTLGDYIVGTTQVKYGTFAFVPHARNPYYDQFEALRLPPKEHAVLYTTSAKHLAEQFDGVPLALSNFVDDAPRGIPTFDYLVHHVPVVCRRFCQQQRDYDWDVVAAQGDNPPWNEITGFYYPTFQEWQDFISDNMNIRGELFRSLNDLDDLPWYDETLAPAEVAKNEVEEQEEDINTDAEEETEEETIE